MKNLKLYESWFSRKKISEEEKIKRFCKKYRIRKYSINEDGSIDVDQDVNLSYDMTLTFTSPIKGKIPIKFGKVDGHFICNYNCLENLENSPTSTIGDFLCYRNGLKTLEHSPLYVGGDFVCHHNILKTLTGGPKFVSKQYNCCNSGLRDLLNEYKVIRNGDTIIKDRLDEALAGIEIQYGWDHEFKNYKII